MVHPFGDDPRKCKRFCKLIGTGCLSHRHHSHISIPKLAKRAEESLAELHFLQLQTARCSQRAERLRGSVGVSISRSESFRSND